MKKINELYNFENKWYDYPVSVEAKHRSYKVNGPKPFRVYHVDGSYSLAYSYGEYQYTFSIEERDIARKAYTEQRVEASKRRALLNKIEKLDTETLQKIVDIIGD